MKNIMKEIDRTFEEWYSINRLNPDEDMNDENEDAAAEYVAHKLNMTAEELDWYLNL